MYLGQAITHLPFSTTSEVSAQIKQWATENNITYELLMEFQNWRREKYPEPELQPGMIASEAIDWWIPTFNTLAEFMLEWREFEEYAGIEKKTPAAVRPSEYPIYDFMRKFGLVFSSPMVTENVYKIGITLVGGYFLIKMLKK